MDRAPRVTVVIPCFDDGAFVEQAVASIRENEPTDVIVVDDGSTDPATKRAMERLERTTTRVIRTVNQGVGRARTTGLEACRTPYLLPLDADDEIFPGCLGKLADALDRAHDAGFAYGNMVIVGEYEGRRDAPRFCAWSLLHLNTVGYCALYRVSSLREAGGWYAGDYEDWDTLLGLAEIGAYGVPIPTDVLRYRTHPSTRLHDVFFAKHRTLFRELQRRHAPLYARRRALAREAGIPLSRRLYYRGRHGARPLVPYRLSVAVSRIRRSRR